MYISSQDYIPEIQMRILCQFNMQISIQCIQKKFSNLTFFTFYSLHFFYFSHFKLLYNTSFFFLHHSLHAADRATNINHRCRSPLEGLYFCRVFYLFCSVLFIGQLQTVSLWYIYGLKILSKNSNMRFGVYDHFVTQHSWFKFSLKPAFLTSYNINSVQDTKDKLYYLSNKYVVNKQIHNK